MQTRRHTDDKAHAPLIAAMFDLEDAAERFTVEVMQRFHRGRLYKTHALKRATNEKRERVVLEVATFHPRRKGAPTEWLLICWNIDERGASFQPHPDQAAAHAAYAAL